METNAVIVVALIAGGVSLVTAIVTAVVTSRLTVWKLRREFLLEMQAEALVRKLLQHRRWRFRTFETLKYHIAGFEDDDLRQVLIRAGAVRFLDNHGEGIWGLIERVDDLLTKEAGTGGN